MPLKKKHTVRNRVIAFIIVIALILLLVLYFTPVQHTTEIVLFP